MSTIAKILSSPPDNFSTTLNGNIQSDTLTIALQSVTGLGTEGVGVIYKKDSDGEPIVGSIEFIHWTGVNASNLTLTDTADRGISGSANGAQSHDSGDTFEVWVHSAYYLGPFGTVEHNADGTHKSDLVTTLKAAGTDITTGTNDTKIVTPKAIKDAADGLIALSDVTTNDVSTSKHGFVPKAPNDTSKFLRGDGAWGSASSGAVSKANEVVLTSSTSTSSSTFSDITSASVSITTSVACNIYVTAHVQAFSNPAAAAEYVVRLLDGSSNQVGSLPQTSLLVGNRRVNIPIYGVQANKAAGTYTYKLQHRSADNATSCTSEGCQITVLAVPA